MALVMLPCEMPWWSMIQRKLAEIQNCTEIDSVLEIMQKIHDCCNVSLDPDEDKRDSTLFDGLKLFYENDLEPDEQEIFLKKTISSIANRAQQLKSWRPPRGLSFSLQQQADSIELESNFASSLLANAFFSTFPKRTVKTHPTLQNFNFTHFFNGLDSNCQKARLKCLLQYFNWLESGQNVAGNMKISRKVMTGKQWLTIEDWLECGLPLCPIDIKHDVKLENSSSDIIQTVFTSSRIGGDVLRSGSSQECLQFSTIPELLVTLLFVEALEDNESLIIEGVRQVARIFDPKNKAIFESLEKPRTIDICCMDAENYSNFLLHQFEEDNILRELNKCLLTFRQNTICAVIETKDVKLKDINENRRLSPIGESGTNTPGDVTTTIVIKQASTSTRDSGKSSTKDIPHPMSKCWLSPDPGGSPGALVVGPTASGRRGRFIVLGSSGECLPVNRRPSSQHTGSSLYSSCDSSEDEFHSAKASIPNSDDEEEFAQKYSKELDTPEKRYTFAQKLRDALQQSDNLTESTDDSYACGISISGSQTCDQPIRLKRRGSHGFVLQEDSMEEDFYTEPFERDKLDKLNNKNTGLYTKPEIKSSSKYSFSTEYSSELEEVYEQFSKYDEWLKEPIDNENPRNLDPRDKAVLRFASSLLKRTLSESFVGVSLTDGCVSSISNPAEATSIQSYQEKNNKPVLNSRSLSLELAKHKHRLAAQLIEKTPQAQGILKPPNGASTHTNTKQLNKHITWSLSLVQSEQTINCDEVVFKIPSKLPVEISQILQRKRSSSNMKPVATGNWGCGGRNFGNVQLKFIIQWMAASVAGLPILIYHTASDNKLSKLDTVCRVIRDRKWSVGRLARITLKYAKQMLDESNTTTTDKVQDFLEKLIGLDRVLS